jgi:serine/threonine protein kinase
MQGQTLDHYKIVEKLGEGGMGEVYRAEDTKLGREVALKVLPQIFTADPERLARFEREARMLAALNHPNIASIYSFERADAVGEGGHPVHFLVMELVGGETLAGKIRNGALPVDEVLLIARQIAEALEAAHERGIIHRDLKPGNVMVDEAGRVKVLDFGLAKALDTTVDASGIEAAAAPSMSPTLTAAMTGANVLLGTAAYMSPEQAKGKAVDKRADIWAFGVMVWEMLTGKRLFAGDSVTDTLADVLRAEIDLAQLAGKVPPPLLDVVRRCLERDADKRLHDIADARLVIDELAAGEWEPPAEVGERKASWLRGWSVWSSAPSPSGC